MVKKYNMFFLMSIFFSLYSTQDNSIEFSNKIRAQCAQMSYIQVITSGSIVSLSYNNDTTIGEVKKIFSKECGIKAKKQIIVALLSAGERKKRIPTNPLQNECKVGEVCNTHKTNVFGVFKRNL